MHLSVVIPLPEAESLLARTLESLLALERPADEVIVASRAGQQWPAAQVERFRSDFQGTLRHVEAGSQAGAVELWDCGVEASRGEWVSLITPQVSVRPNFTQALADSAGRCPTAGVVRAGWTRERPFGGPAEQHTLLSVRTVTHPAEALYEQRFGPKASTAAAAVRRDVWERMGRFPAEISLLGDWIGDWSLWLTAGACADTVRSPEVIADIHAGPSPAGKAEEMRQMYLIYREVLPRAVEVAKLSDATWIAAASRKRFRDVAIAASNDLRPGRSAERDELALALQAWARSVEQEPLLDRLRAGEKIRSFALGKKMKPALRRVVAAVR